MTAVHKVYLHTLWILQRINFLSFSVKCVGGMEESEVPQRNFKFRMLCGYGASAYSWYKDGIPLNISTYLVEENGRIVAVTNETMNSSGLYTCITSDVIRQWYLPPQASRGMYVQNTFLVGRV